MNNKSNVQELKSLLDKEKPNIEKIFCDNCDENMVFNFKDGNHIFHLPLSKILECLLIAEAEGQVPEIDENWWNILEELYPNIENLRIELKSEE